MTLRLQDCTKLYFRNNSIAVIPTTKAGLYKVQTVIVLHIGGWECTVVNKYCIFKNKVQIHVSLFFWYSRSPYNFSIQLNEQRNKPVR